MLQVTSLKNTVGPTITSLGRGARRGSGLVVAENRVIAMSHSLRSDELELRIAGDTRQGTLESSDRATGISLIAVPTGDIAPATWSDARPQLGDVVYALADPGTGLRITEGRVSAEPFALRGRAGRLIEGIEHTAPLPRGSSGGPLVDGDGAVLGLNVLRTDPGLLFAIGTAAVRPAVERLLAGLPEPARLGVAIAPPRVARGLRRAVGLPDRDGLLVRDVEDDSPASRAGVQRGDLIVGFGASEIDSVEALFSAIAANANEEAALKLVRGSDELELSLNLTGGGA